MSKKSDVWGVDPAFTERVASAAGAVIQHYLSLLDTGASLRELSLARDALAVVPDGGEIGWDEEGSPIILSRSTVTKQVRTARAYKAHEDTHDEHGFPL